jgi:hypothetical protein
MIPFYLLTIGRLGGEEQEENLLKKNGFSYKVFFC